MTDGGGNTPKAGVGKVKAVFSKLESNLYPGVMVEWRGVIELSVHHLGEQGKVDIKYRSPADGGMYYWHHLPAPCKLHNKIIYTYSYMYGTMLTLLRR